MTGIAAYKSNGHVYLRIEEPLVDGEGHPRKRRYRNVGKVDPATGKNVYYADFIEEVRGTDREPKDMREQLLYSKLDIQNSETKEYGVDYILTNIAEKIGLTDALQFAFRFSWFPIISLAKFLASTGEPAMYCALWLEKTDGVMLPPKLVAISDKILENATSLTSEDITLLLRSIAEFEKAGFYSKWSENVKTNKMLALDLTSASSYSD
ncbi:MAG: hypothetical protein LBR80_05830 [Deltaproteobacteria bacterium]|nr:hypothetical protein [Deltaproteobacteria bacterium]